MADARIIGIDYGTKRVGIALSDPLLLFAQVDGTYDEERAVQRLDELHAAHDVSTIVVGWPLTLEGEEGDATAFVRPFVNRLRKRYRDVEVLTWDERFSSERAKEALARAGVKRSARRRKGRVDAAAAAVILQDYLDERRRSA